MKAVDDLVLVYQIEGDDAVHVNICGVKIGAFGPSTAKAVALLKYEAERRAASAARLLSYNGPPHLPLASHWLADRDAADKTRHAQDRTGCVFYFADEAACIEFLEWVTQAAIVADKSEGK